MRFVGMIKSIKMGKKKFIVQHSIEIPEINQDHR